MNKESQEKALELLRASSKTNYQIAKETGISEATIGNYVNKKTKPTPANAKILIGYFSKTPAHSKDMDGYRMVPVYNFDVVGGMDAWNDVVGCPEYIEKYVPFSGASENDLCVHVTGNSMMPTYSSGSLLLIRRVEGWREYFGYGHCYVILLKDGRRILKEVQKSEVNPKENVLCVSYNPKIPPEELSREFIADVYKVIMTLTNEGY